MGVLKPFAFPQHLLLSVPGARRLHLQTHLYLSQISTLGPMMTAVRSKSPQKWECLVQREQLPVVASKDPRAATAPLVEQAQHLQPSSYDLHRLNEAF